MEPSDFDWDCASPPELLPFSKDFKATYGEPLNEEHNLLFTDRPIPHLVIAEARDACGDWHPLLLRPVVIFHLDYGKLRGAGYSIDWAILGFKDLLWSPFRLDTPEDPRGLSEVYGEVLQHPKYELHCEREMDWSGYEIDWEIEPINEPDYSDGKRYGNIVSMCDVYKDGK
ncbi:MAG: hypothetical protein H7Y17_11615, partial [Chlorobia bacterium]|nr:hypothetical protein [Fimbriimonadaceae bacterium]